MTDHIVTLGGVTYRLHWSGTTYAGGQHLCYLQAPPDGRRLASVRRAWLPMDGGNGQKAVVWGWLWEGTWYSTAEALVGAVLGQQAAQPVA